MRLLPFLPDPATSPREWRGAMAVAAFYGILEASASLLSGHPISALLCIIAVGSCGYLYRDLTRHIQEHDL